MAAGQKKHPGILLQAVDDSIDLQADGDIAANTSGGGPPTGPAGGDLSGTYPNPTVDGLQTIPVSAVVPTPGQFLGYDGLVWEPTTIVIPTTLPPSGPAGGDLAGTYPNPQVDGIQGVSIPLAPTVSGTVLQYDGTNLVFVAPPGGPPSGAAGGDLSGTYPNPTVDGLQTVPVSAVAPTNGQFLGYNGATWIATTITIPTTLPPSGAAGGDLSGTYPNPTVDGLQTVPVSAVAPTSGQFLGYNGATWIATTISAAAIGVEPATPATIPLRTAAGGVRANALSADVGDLEIGHTSPAATAPGAGNNVVITGQNANTTGFGGELVIVGGNAASGDSSPQTGGGVLIQLGTNAGGDPIGATFRILTGTGDLVFAGGVRGIGASTQTQDTITGGSSNPEIDNTSGSLGEIDLRWVSVNAADLFARGDAANNVKAQLSATALTFTSTSGGARGAATITARDTLRQGQQRDEVTTQAANVGGTTTLDLDTGGIQRITLGGNTTIAFSNLRDGGRWTIELIQDATGGRVVTWPAGIVWPNGQAPVQSRAANARDSFTFYREDGVGADPMCESFIIENGTALGYQFRTATAGTNVTLRVNDYLRTPGTSTATHTLPDATNLTPNHSVTWKETAAGTSAITFDVAGGGTIDGAATYASTTARAGITFVAAGNGTNTWDAFPPA